jgi:tetratricopeptide (TPR) repeat protein
MRTSGFVLLMLLFAGTAAAQQGSAADRDRARTQNRLGWEALRAEKYEQAIKSFQEAIDIRRDYEYAHYGLGRTYLAMRRYADAVTVLERCKNLYLAQGSRQFTNVQEATRFREDRVIEIDEQIRLLRQGPQTVQTQDLIRQYETTKRNLQENIRRSQGMTIDATVPSWVSLSLGSAYFRNGRLKDAEGAYLEAIRTDAGLGEAHNNLAVVYLETERFTEAQASLRAAKKAGFRVNPELEKVIESKAPKVR